MAKKTKTNLNLFSLVLLGVMFGLLAVASISLSGRKELDTDNTEAAANSRKQILNPNDFTTNITNRYTALPIGRKLIYREKTEAGIEKIEISIPGETKKVKYQN